MGSLSDVHLSFKRMWHICTLPASPVPCIERAWTSQFKLPSLAMTVNPNRSKWSGFRNRNICRSTKSTLSGVQEHAWELMDHGPKDSMVSRKKSQTNLWPSGSYKLTHTNFWMQQICKLRCWYLHGRNRRWHEGPGRAWLAGGCPQSKHPHQHLMAANGQRGKDCVNANVIDVCIYTYI